MVRKSIIYGAGGLGREIRSMLPVVYPDLELMGFIDDGLPKGTMVDQLEVLGSGTDLNQKSEDINVFIGIGSPSIKAKVITTLSNPHLHFPALIHPAAIIQDSQTVVMGKGVVIGAGVVLTTGITIGNYVLINLNVTAGHNSSIGDFASIMPGANLAGDVKIGSEVMVGSGANILNGIIVGKGARVGSGAVVTRDVPNRVTVIGVPANPVK